MADVGKTFTILIEGESKKSDADWMGRSSHNKVVVIPKNGIICKGDYATVKVYASTGGTLLGELI